MLICFYFPSMKNAGNNSVFGGMYTSFFFELDKLDIKAKLVTDLHEVEGDLLVVSTGNGGEKQAAKAMLKLDVPVILSIYNSYISFYKPFLSHWSNRILFAYNPDSASLNYIKYNLSGIRYFHFPFGSDPKVFHPLNEEKIYDIAFLGNASSGYGRERYIGKLIHYVKQNNLKIFLAGSGWEKYGFPTNIVAHGAETNLIYNRSKVCVNIHNDRQYAGEDKEMDANNRLFDLAMAGCCQISNGEKMVAKYFESDEVAVVDDPDEWIAKIDYYLKNEIERKKIGQKALERAISEHTWEKRAAEFAKMIHKTMDEYQFRNQKAETITRFLRKIDSLISPLYLLKEIRIIRKILFKTGFFTPK